MDYTHFAASWTESCFSCRGNVGAAVRVRVGQVLTNTLHVQLLRAALLSLLLNAAKSRLLLLGGAVVSFQHEQGNRGYNRTLCNL